MSRPQSWAEATDRLGYALASQDAAEEWIRQAVGDPRELTKTQRALALQRLCGIVLTIEDIRHDLAFDPDVREIIKTLFVRFFKTTTEGPNWRLAPTETERPVYVSDDFDAPTSIEEVLARRDRNVPLESYGPEHTLPSDSEREGL